MDSGGGALSPAMISKCIAIVGVTALAGVPGITVSAECGDNASGRVETAKLDYSRVVLLDDAATTTANVSIGDLNGDGFLDLMLINGRHWPVANRIFLGDGSGSFNSVSNLGEVEDRSYTGALADIDLDGDLDVVVSNDKPDPKYVYLNDGGRFSISSTFGQPDWNTRNISLADVNYDGLPDVIVANRSPHPSPNYICFNLGEGKFDSPCRPFSEESATTITPFDVNGDALYDFVVPSRDGAQSNVYLSKSRTAIELEPIPFGPPDAAIRATQVADFDCDGFMDIAAIHTRSSEARDGSAEKGRIHRGTAIYYGMKEGGYSDAVVLIDSSEMPYALAVEDLNQDGKMDVIVGHVEASTAVLVNTGSDKQFLTIELGDSDGATYGFDTGDLDQDGHLDIVVAKSGAQNRIFFGSRAAEE